MQDMICLKDHPLVGEFIKCMMLALVTRMIVARLVRIPKKHQAPELSPSKIIFGRYVAVAESEIKKTNYRRTRLNHQE